MNQHNRLKTGSKVVRVNKHNPLQASLQYVARVVDQLATLTDGSVIEVSGYGAGDWLVYKPVKSPKTVNFTYLPASESNLNRLKAKEVVSSTTDSLLQIRDLLRDMYFDVSTMENIEEEVSKLLQRVVHLKSLSICHRTEN